jgi:hypothetical protein
MMTLCRVMHTNWHAVERDLIALGHRANDIGTPKLTLWELISIVVAAPIGSSVREVLDGGWSRTDSLLANLGEQQSGHLQLTGRYPRPGVTSDQVFQGNSRITTIEKPAYGVKMTAMPKDEFVQKMTLARSKIKADKGNG